MVKRLFATKNTQTLIDEAYHPERMMKKTLSVFDLIAFGVGATIGSGIFALTGTAAAGSVGQTHDWLSTPIMNFILGSDMGRAAAGPAIVISFILAAIACGFAALCYAELASTIPVSGSAYTFAYAALGQVVAWVIGWDLILEYAVGNIAVAVSWSDYFLHFFNAFTGLKLPLWLTTDTTTAMTRIAQMANQPHQQSLYSSLDLPNLFGHQIAINVPAFAIVAFITWLLVVGIKESAWVNTLAVIIKVGIVLFFVGYGAGFVKPVNWVPFAPGGLAGVMGGAAIVFFSFIGFDAVSSTAEETKNPQRDMPIGMLGSLFICTILYAAVSLVLTGIMPYQRYANDAAPVATALAQSGQPWAEMVVALGALAGMTSVLLVFQLGQPRIFMAMARDRLLPKMFGKLHPRFRTPFVPTILTGVFVGVTALFMDIGQAAELTNIGTLAAFIIVCGGVLVLRKTDSARHRPFSCPFVPVVPILGILFCFVLMLSLPVITWLRFFGWLAAGMAIYFAYGYRQHHLPEAALEKLPTEKV
ncbi:MAG: amino acid permease [Candidatus Obscuribacterales bacterium]|nr:amino acid permease [Candidatus Obscuribacterales bacterium]